MEVCQLSHGAYITHAVVLTRTQLGDAILFVPTMDTPHPTTDTETWLGYNDGSVCCVFHDEVCLKETHAIPYKHPVYEHMLQIARDHLYMWNTAMRNKQPNYRYFLEFLGRYESERAQWKIKQMWMRYRLRSSMTILSQIIRKQKALLELYYMPGIGQGYHDSLSEFTQVQCDGH